MTATEPRGQIRILPTQVANKIAAGEVVERPASVAKELIENAIDAGCTRLDVEITMGGRKLVAVRDNGAGMRRDDALLSIERHATSKIRDVDDIEKIGTLGFRGEALAAIASVSRFRLQTCAQGEDVGTEMRVCGGKLQDVRDAGCPAGTTIEVRDLFFNVPARRKFLRAVRTEQTHARSGFIVQALANPRVGMSLKVDGRDVYRLPSDDRMEDRIRALFGPEHLENLRSISHKTGFAEVTGYAGVPGASRSDRSEQYIFVNGRATSSALIYHAIREGYRTLLPSDRQPVLFLFVRVDPRQVDVNVHPTKREVRFRQPGQVRDAVIEALHQSLRSEAHEPDGPSKEGGLAYTRPLPEMQSAAMRLTIENLPATRAFRYPRIQGAGEPQRAHPPGEDGMGSSASEARGAGMAEEPGGSSADADHPRSPWSWCRVLGQIGGLYVVLETEDGMVLMDPHAAHERVLFEAFMADVLKGKVESQTLLVPETVELQAKDALRVRKSLGVLKTLGFGISEFGGDAFVVDALPSYFEGTSVQALLPDIAQELEQSGARNAKGRWREESIAQAACKTAVKARDRLTLEEIERLVIDLANAEMPYTCPHGRPTLIHTSFRELHRRFGRG